MKIPIIFLLIISSACFGQQVNLEGRVISDKNTIIPFATISLKNTKIATVTNEQGKFELKDIPFGEYTIEASSVGYKTQAKRIAVNASQTPIEIILLDASQELAEVSVTAEKTSKVQEQRAIAIKSIEIKDVIAQNTLLTDIADRISGVRIRRSSSLGEKSDISINGMRGNAIRVYIDGLPMEFMYPNFDISTLPLSNIKRMDVFKGVLPVDVGTDAMGGAINIITEQKAHSHLRASYSLGSFNTHLADFEVGLANKKNLFLNVNVAHNYSDNDYKMKAFVFEKNKIETVRRFHDKYKMTFGGISMGVHSKKWADELRLAANISSGIKELQNGARISSTSIGEANYQAYNYSVNLKYEKSFFNEKLKINNIANYSFQALDYVDTTANVYSWSGKVVGKNVKGEYLGESNYTTYYNNKINRTTLSYLIAKNHKLLFSNLIANQKLTGQDYLKDKDERDYLTIPQFLTKNIVGIQYDGNLTSKITFSTAAKRYDYVLNGAENNTFELIKKKDNFWSWNTGFKYSFTDNIFARISYEKGYLIPFFEQFVGNGADIVRNTELIPENSDNLNLGLSLSQVVSNDLKISTNINAFWREQYNIIFLGSGVVKRYDNADQVNTLGFEGDLVLNFKKAFTWRSNITALRKRFSALKDPRNAFLVGSIFPNNPTFFGNTELDWQKNGLLNTADKFRVYAFYQFVAPFNHILIGQDDNFKNNADAFVPIQNRLDVGTSYRFAKQNLTAAFNINNILNAELFDNFLVPRAGINFNLKLIFEINKF
ncbi:MAG: TonB-dependent receptor [Arcicella sp.]|nr:TonB-dependent receptor [Arcicella sp.]